MTTWELSPVLQAEETRQMVGVLRRMGRRLEEGGWGRGHRFGRDGRNCLLGLLDEATVWTLPSVEVELPSRLVQELPRPFRLLAPLRPRVALAAYNDLGREPERLLRLVRPALHALGAGGWRWAEGCGDTDQEGSTAARQPAS